MAIRKSTLNITKVARDASDTFVAPKPLATNEAVRNQIVEDSPVVQMPQRPLKRVCTIQKVGGFSFFTSEEDRNALDFISFRNKFEKQNVVRAALHDFLLQHYKDGVGLDDAALQMLNDYESSIYKYV